MMVSVMVVHGRGSCGGGRGVLVVMQHGHAVVRVLVVARGRGRREHAAERVHHEKTMAMAVSPFRFVSRWP